MTKVVRVGSVGSLLLVATSIYAQGVSPSPEAKPQLQSIHSEGKPIVAARRFALVPAWTDLKAGVGYSYASIGMPSASRVNLSGVSVPVIADLAPDFGIAADATYARASHLFSTPQHADVLSYLIGPVLYPVKVHRVRFYVQGLAGGARVAGGIPNSPGGSTGYVNKFSWAAGGGIEYQLSGAWTWRSGTVYQKTAFYNSELAIRGQNDFRLVSSVIFMVWQHPKRRD